jgi:hypothetical protein
MKDSTKTIISGIVVVVSCFCMSIWIVSLTMTGQVSSGPLYGFASAFGFLLMGIYFCFEVKKCQHTI